MKPDKVKALQWERARSAGTLLGLLHHRRDGWRSPRKLHLALAAVARTRWAGLIGELKVAPLLDVGDPEADDVPPFVEADCYETLGWVTGDYWFADESDLPDAVAAENVCNVLANLAAGNFAETVECLEAAEVDAGRKPAAAGVGAALREVFGNPFRPVRFDPDWQTPAVLAIADGCYTGRAFDRLQVLADALEDAGCDAPDLLAHLRGPGPHVRGCWALDLVLGKG